MEPELALTDTQRSWFEAFKDFRSSFHVRSIPVGNLPHLLTPLNVPLLLKRKSVHFVHEEFTFDRSLLIGRDLA